LFGSLCHSRYSIANGLAPVKRTGKK
jgi:hypothetical protein